MSPSVLSECLPVHQSSVDCQHHRNTIRRQRTYQNCAPFFVFKCASFIFMVTAHTHTRIHFEYCTAIAAQRKQQELNSDAKAEAIFEIHTTHSAHLMRINCYNIILYDSNWNSTHKVVSFVVPDTKSTASTFTLASQAMNITAHA